MMAARAEMKQRAEETEENTSKLFRTRIDTISFH